MHNSLAKKLFAVGVAGATALMSFAPFAAHAAVHAAGTNVKSSDGTIWMVTTDGYRRPYTSAGAFLSYGFNSFAGVVDASAEDLALPAGSFIPPQDGSIICSDRGSDKGTCYFISSGMKFGFTSAAVFTGLGFSFSHSKMGDVSWMPSGSSLINSSTMQHMTGALINKSGTVYLVGANGLLGIPDLNTFNSWGYSFSNVVPANAADGSLSQTGVMSMRTAGMLSPSWTTSGNTGGNNPPVVNGSVTATLASDTPAANSIVAGQAIADLAHFTFSGTGSVTQVVLKRTGVSADTTLSNVYLYNGNTKLTDAGSVSNGLVTFNNASGIFTVNGSITISVKADITAGVSGQTLGMQLSSFTVANGTPATTSLSGNIMTVASVSNLATVAATASSSIATSINAGTMNATLWGATFSVGQRNVQLKYLKLKQIGSIPSDALQNLQLYVAGSPVGSKVSVNSNNDVVFDMTGSPVTMQTGSPLVEVRGDVVKGSSRTFTLQLQTASDMVVVDPNYGVNILVTATAAGMSFPVVSGAGATTVSSGSLSVQSDASFSATQMVKNAANVTLGQWTVKAYGEDVKVQNLQVILNYTGTATSTEGFNNVTVYVNGAAVGSSQSAIETASATTHTLTFGTTNLFTVPAGTQVTVAVKGDNTLLTSTAVTGVRTDLVIPATALQGVTSFNTLSGGTGTYTGVSLSVASSSVTLAKNGSYANQTVSSNTVKQKIGSYTIQASNAEAVRVTTLTVGLSGTGSPGFTSPNALANLYIVPPTGTVTPVNPGASNNFSVDFTVAANQTATVDVFADISNATGTISTTLSGSGTGVGSGSSVTLSSTSGQTITVGNGTLATPTLQSSSPVAQLVLSGATSQPVGTYNFVSSNGGVTITELGFFVATSSGATTVPVTAIAVNGGSATPVVGSTSTITGLSIAVPSGFSGTNVAVTANIGTVSPLSGMISNSAATVKLSYIKYTSGGLTTTVFPAVSSNTMTVVAGKPSITLATSGTLAPGTSKVASVTVSADSAGGDIILTQLPLVFATSGGATIAAGSTILVKDGNTTIATTGTTVASSTSTATVSVAFTNGYRITAGTSKTLDIYAPVSGTFSTSPGATVTTSLDQASLFTWTDVNGNLAGITGSAIYNYPTTSVALHN